MKTLKIPEQSSQEIEIKLSLDASDYLRLQEWLSSSAKFMDQTDQLDIYFNNPRDSWMRRHEDGYKYALKYLRVRVSDEGSSMCFKDWETTGSKGKCGVYCRDIEFSIADPVSQVAMLENIGYTETTEIRKSRTSYSHGDFRIDIDHCPGVGTFVEFEVKERKYDSPEKEYERLQEFVDGLGLKSPKKQNQGFIVLAWNPGVDFSRVV